MAQIDFKKATIKIKDGTAVTPLEIEIRTGEGNLTFDETRNLEYIRNRGKLDTVREDDEDPVEVSLDTLWENITSSTGDPITPVEAIKGKGGASSWVSVGSDPCEPYAVNIEIEYEPACTGVQNETILLPEFRYTGISFDMSAGTIAFSGSCNVTEVTTTRSDA